MHLIACNPSPRNLGLVSQLLSNQATSYQVYKGGSDCEVKDARRKTEVRYMCSKSGATAITSIREVHSCSYQIMIATPLICQHPDFAGVQVLLPILSSVYFHLLAK